jgi:hypothetical protein
MFPQPEGVRKRKAARRGGESHRAVGRFGKWHPMMADTLDQDVQALKDWLRQAWSYLAQPSLTRFERQEMRNQMKLADAKLRAGLQKVAARDRTKLGDRDEGYSSVQPADYRLLKVEA